ncbi:restriction endonuclease [Gordonia hydrophobica]|uniref:Restriction endonuclease n=2 Tax=Gordonia hydrophobica TaxID=40516 RepID=A0ABZ2U732_9ACTN|nr:restriction endonuclease [Gordonia hydrophobica]
MSMSPKVPSYRQMLWPTLQSVISLGGSASIEELDTAVIDLERYPEEMQAVLHGDGPGTEVNYRLAWARTYLKGMGLLTNSKRGVWSVTEAGRAATPGVIEPLHAEYRLRTKQTRDEKRQDKPDDDVPEHRDVDESDWQEVLLDTLLAMSPKGFENLARRLLRESGFSSVVVTGQSGDGGIDGMGVLQVSLLSFPVYFQCKRYKGSVGSGAVRDFRGAMVGRGEKGLLITTGAFTKEAQVESKRDGAPPIDLIDGARLCELLKENSLGVDTTPRVVEDITIHPDFFRSLEPGL